MSRSPLVALLLSFSFALQLVLTGAGTTCILPGGAGHGSGIAAAVDGMPGMNMADRPAKTDASPDDRGSAEAPCNHATARVSCVIMAPCAGGFVGNVATVSAGTSPALISVAGALVAMPLSPTIPPEPPPPRA